MLELNLEMVGSAPQRATGCATFQSSSDTNYPELDSIGFSVQSHETAFTPDTSHKSGGPRLPPLLFGLAPNSEALSHKLSPFRFVNLLK